jgi:hypothetical protein
MKKKLMSVALVALLFSASPIKAEETTTNPPKTTLTESEKAEKIASLTIRLEEIKASDKTNLNRAEKKALRNEVKSIKREVHRVDGGVYISLGAIIIIVLLLIILL